MNLALSFWGLRLPKDWPCKPCWELKYCPYGPLVEFFPLLDRQNPKAKSYLGHKEVMAYSPSDRVELLEHCDPYGVDCNIFGHVCPVFVMAEPFTETRQVRRSTRDIPRDIVLKVIRRDNYICQECHEHVPDDQIEIDHIIPHSKGGPMSVANLRLLCRSCNRKKSNRLLGLLSAMSVVRYAQAKNPRKRSVKT